MQIQRLLSLRSTFDPRIGGKSVKGRLLNFRTQNEKRANQRNLSFRINGFYSDGRTINVQGEIVQSQSAGVTKSQSSTEVETIAALPVDEKQRLCCQAYKPLGCSGIDPGMRAIATIARGHHLTFRFLF
jgi:hypothetical protein